MMERFPDRRAPQRRGDSMDILPFPGQQSHPDPFVPTDAVPGSEEKIRILEARAALVLSLDWPSGRRPSIFHPRDRRGRNAFPERAFHQGTPGQGVDRKHGRYRARVYRDGREILLGRYATAEEAERAVLAARQRRAA
jgi:hypothetical protein